MIELFLIEKIKCAFDFHFKIDFCLSMFHWLLTCAEETIFRGSRCAQLPQVYLILLVGPLLDQPTTGERWRCNEITARWKPGAGRMKVYLHAALSAIKARWWKLRLVDGWFHWFWLWILKKSQKIFFLFRILVSSEFFAVAPSDPAFKGLTTCLVGQLKTKI